MRKIFFLIFAISFLTATRVQGQGEYSPPDTSRASIDPLREVKAKTLALEYCSMLMKGVSTDSIAAICTIPFSWDRKQIISDWETFHRIHREVFEKKGINRPWSCDSIYVMATRKEVLDEIIPIDIYYVIVRINTVGKGKERAANVMLAVQMGDEPKIVGLSD
jgi:hypothetical protein